MKLFLVTILVVCVGAQDYNCFSREVWSPEKKEYCCREKKLGCPAQPQVSAMPAGCGEVLCMLFCPNGFQKDKNGCDVCKCADAAAAVKASSKLGQPGSKVDKAGADYNCYSREKWSPEKKTWCCANKKLGCTPGQTTVQSKVAEVDYNCYSREKWSPEKSTWCCNNKKLGCAAAAVATAPVIALQTRAGLAPATPATAATAAAVSASATATASKPRFVSTYKTTSTTAEVVWAPPRDNFECSDGWYEVFLKKVGSETPWTQMENAMKSDPVQIFQDLQPRTRYRVKIVPHTEAGAGTPAFKRFRTKKEV